jgi:TPR repeat protein
VRKNYVKAFKLLEKSIEWEPNKDAYFDIAVCYETGKGTKKDLRKAFQSYLLASFYGDNKAKYEVGRCFYYGIGISKDTELGYEITELFSVPPNL